MARATRVEEGQHLRPFKRLLVDVTSSMAGLDKALGFANDLFKVLETAGHRVAISTAADCLVRCCVDKRERLPAERGRQASYDYNRLWSPQRPTVVYVGSVAFGLAIIEMSESAVVRYVDGKWIRESGHKPAKWAARYGDHSWTTTKEIPCGRLRLVVYAPYGGVSWSMLFQETVAAELTKQIPEIVKSIESSTEVLAEKVREAEREGEVRRQEWEAQRERWRQEEDRRRVAESVQESRDQLDGVIREWARVMSLEQFFKGVESYARDLPEEQRQQVLKRLEMAREFVGPQDPMHFFRSWKTPIERYVPLLQTPGAENEEREEDDEEVDG